MSHVLGSSLHQHKGVAMLCNEALEGKVALTFPLLCVEKLLVPLDLRSPFVHPSVLDEQGKPGIPPILASLKRSDGSSIRGGLSGLLKLVVDRIVVFPEQGMAMRGSKDQLCLNILVFSRMGSSCCLLSTYQRHSVIGTDDGSQGNSPHADDSVKIIPECFSPFDYRQSLSNLWHLGLVATFLGLQSLPLFGKVLHDGSPLKISSSGVPANNGVIKANNKLRSIDQTLLRLDSKDKR